MSMCGIRLSFGVDLLFDLELIERCFRFMLRRCFGSDARVFSSSSEHAEQVVDLEVDFW